MSRISQIKIFIKNKLGSSEKKNILSSISWLFFDKVLRLGVGLVVGVWVARYLGPFTYGSWNYVIAFVGVFSAFATMGLDSVVVRELIESPEKHSSILGTVFIIRLSGSLLTCVLATGFFIIFNTGSTELIEIILISSASLILQSIDVIDLYFQSRVESKFTVIAKNTSFLIFALIRVLLIISKSSLIAFVWCSLLEIALSEIILIAIFYIKKLKVTSWRLDLALGKQFLDKGWRLTLSGLMISIYMRIDQVMLGIMAGKKIVGIYTAGVRIAEVWYFIPLAILTSVYPLLVTAKKESPDRYTLRLKQLFFYLSLISIAISIIINIFSAFIINMFFGSDYMQSAQILSVTIWAGVFVFLGVGGSQALVIDELYNLLMIRTIVGAVSNIGLNLFLIPRYQGLGASYATLIAYALSGFLLNFFNRQTRGLFYIQLRSLFFIDQILRLKKLTLVKITKN